LRQRQTVPMSANTPDYTITSFVDIMETGS
jgi:hypothetical protein